MSNQNIKNNLEKLLKLETLAILVPTVFVLLQILDFFVQPYVFFTTVEIDTYPVIWTTDENINQNVPLKFQRVVAKQVSKMTAVGIRNVGGRTAHDVYINFPRKDDYKGWLIRDGVDGQKELDFMRPTIKLDTLIPGESVSIFVYSPSSDESIIDDIDVRYDNGGEAAHYPSMPVPSYIGEIFKYSYSKYIPLFILILMFWSGLYWYNRYKK